MKTLKIIITGTVQGVFFRSFIKEEAEKLELKGFVRNLDNGKLEVVVEGRDQNADEMVKVCSLGPKHSKVDDVESQEIKHQGFDDFKVLRV